MIEIAITLLTYLLIPAAMVQPSAQRLFASIVFVAIIHAHQVYFVDLEGVMYFLSAALLSLLIIIVTSGINPAPKMVVEIHKICIASAVLNFLGWLLWESYVSSTYYNLSFVVVYAWAFFTLIDRDPSDVGNYKLDSWWSCLRFNHHPIYIHLFKNKEPS